MSLRRHGSHLQLNRLSELGFMDIRFYFFVGEEEVQQLVVVLLSFKTPSLQKKT